MDFRTVAVAQAPDPVNLGRFGMHLLSMRKIGLQKHLPAIALLASLVAYQGARAQEPLHFPSPELAIPGVEQKSSVSTPAIEGSAYADVSAAQALAMQFKDAIPHTRSVHDSWVLSQAAPGDAICGLRSRDLVLHCNLGRRGRGCRLLVRCSTWVNV